MKIKTKQLLVTIYKIPWIKFDSRIKNLELYENEFHFYQNEDDIIIEHEFDRYFIELFFKNETSYKDILKIEEKCREKMIEHFDNKINKFNELIKEVKRYE
jgi:hypothetical protein